jgi:hypothetical protein
MAEHRNRTEGSRICEGNVARGVLVDGLLAEEPFDGFDLEMGII